ncbi:MAG: hypothetical protein Edafosvirus8_19 [Edafosvirus sp.]|uniref:Minor capsid protein P8 central region domain-containing protein n=1 Tax=Edafosvirus sp. TaxID=2487765 RepID=A0A3G4ZXZ4_9VIRU|nr:MAG: hypothetical protein Edafosvirus8_19 [Edafosvirus sp.]
MTPTYGQSPFDDQNSSFNLSSEVNKKNVNFEDPLYNKGKDYYKNMAGRILKGVFIPTDLSRLFFSNENIKRIQNMIKKEIYNKTEGKFKVDDQDESDLLVAMRATFMNYGDFLPDKIIHQVKLLNKRVVCDVLPDMITNIKQYYSYIDEINKPIQPIARPLNVSHAGRRTLPSLTSAWGF